MASGWLMGALLLLGQGGDDSLGYVSENLAQGRGNWYQYLRIWISGWRSARETPSSTTCSSTRATPSRRAAWTWSSRARRPCATGICRTRKEGARTATLPLRPQSASGTPPHPLAGTQGRTAISWNLAFEGDAAGTYAQFVDNIGVVHADSATTWIYRNWYPPGSRGRAQRRIHRRPLVRRRGPLGAGQPARSCRVGAEDGGAGPQPGARSGGPRAGARLCAREPGREARPPLGRSDGGP